MRFPLSVSFPFASFPLVHSLTLAGIGFLRAGEMILYSVRCVRTIQRRFSLNVWAWVCVEEK